MARSICSRSPSSLRICSEARLIRLIESGSKTRACSIEGIVKKILVRKLGVEEKQLVPSADIVRDLKADSSVVLELNMAYEEAFGIVIPNADSGQLTTVGAVIDYVNSRVPKARLVQLCPEVKPKTPKCKDSAAPCSAAEVARQTLEQKLEYKVRHIIAEVLDVDECWVTPNASFEHDLCADSFDQVLLIMAFEETFDIEISDKAADKIRTVKDAIAYLKKKAPQKWWDAYPDNG